MAKLFFRRLLRRKRFYFSLAIGLFFIWVYPNMDMRFSDAVYSEILGENHFDYEPSFHYQEVADRKLRYLQMGDSKLPLIVFIHGAPSSSRFWKDMLRDSSLLSRARLLAVDRPGYGFSGYGKPLISVKEQAAMIAQILLKKRREHQKIILHGSSYGGTVAARIAMDFPHLVDGLLLQSSSLKAGSEKTYWISYPTHHWALRWLMPGTIRTANAEKLSHYKQLRAMEPFWERITAASILLHGTADGLIYPDNAPFAYRQLVNARYRDLQMIDKRGHDLLWTRRDLLKQSLLTLLDL